MGGQTVHANVAETGAASYANSIESCTECSKQWLHDTCLCMLSAAIMPCRSLCTMPCAQPAVASCATLGRCSPMNPFVLACLRYMRVFRSTLLCPAFVPQPRLAWPPYPRNSSAPTTAHRHTQNPHLVVAEPNAAVRHAERQHVIKERLGLVVPLGRGKDLWEQRVGRARETATQAARHAGIAETSQVTCTLN